MSQVNPSTDSASPDHTSGNLKTPSPTSGQQQQYASITSKIPKPSSIPTSSYNNNNHYASVKSYSNQVTNSIDPKISAGVKSTFLCYQIAEVVRSSDLPTPDLLPYGYCVGSVQEVNVWLRGGLQLDSNLTGQEKGDSAKAHDALFDGDATSISFATNIPAGKHKLFIFILLD